VDTSGTIDDVLDQVGDDAALAAEALELERADKNRSTLISRLESIVESASESESASEPPEPPADEAPGAAEKKYRALKRMQAMGNVYQPGDLVPPAGSWVRVESYVRAGWLEEVDD
jgi:hypothetical protein